jgi:hypothetical protein
MLRRFLWISVFAALNLTITFCASAQRRENEPIAAVQQPPSNAGGQAPGGGGTQARGEENRFKWMEPVGVLVTGAFTVVLAVATIRLWKETARLAAFAAIQAKDMKDAVAAATTSADAAVRSFEQMKNESTLRLRAYVNVLHAKKEEFPTVGSENNAVVFSARFKNVGQTPANRFAFSGEVVCGGRKAVEEKAIHVDAADAPMSLVPGAEVSGHFSGAFTREEIASVRDGKTAIYLVGTAVYQDVFNNSREIRFCYYLGGDYGVQHESLAISGFGNSAT